MPMTGVRGMTATQALFQGGKTMSQSSGHAVAAVSASAGPSNARQAPMTDLGSTVTVQKPTRAQLVLELAKARRAVLMAEQDRDSLSDSESCHSDDIGGGPVSLGQPSPSTARESPSTGVYSPPLPTTASTPYEVSRGHLRRLGLRVLAWRVNGATWDRHGNGTESYSSCSSVLALGVNGANWDARE